MTDPRGTDAPTRWRLRVGEQDAGQRLDVFLAGRIEETSRAAVQRAVHDGRVLVNGAPSRSSARVHAGDAVELESAPPRPRQVVPEPIELDVLYEDDWLAAIDKPPGMVVHPGAGRDSGTVAHAVSWRWGRLSRFGGEDRPGIVHRLDRDTTGVLLVARDDRTHRELSELFRTRRVQKEYRAVVLGTPEHTTGIVELPIGRDPRHRKRMAVRREGGRPALTTWRVLEHLPPVSYVACFPHTGRTHQIRVHMRAIQHPILGDPVYGLRPGSGGLAPRAEEALRGFAGTALHAFAIRFPHPRTGEAISIRAPLPASFQRLLERLRGIDRTAAGERSRS